MYSLISNTFMVFGLLAYTLVVQSGRDSKLAQILCLALLVLGILMSVVQEYYYFQDVDKLTRRVQELEEKTKKDNKDV